MRHASLRGPLSQPYSELVKAGARLYTSESRRGAGCCVHSPAHAPPPGLGRRPGPRSAARRACVAAARRRPSISTPLARRAAFQFLPVGHSGAQRDAAPGPAWGAERRRCPSAARRVRSEPRAAARQGRRAGPAAPAAALATADAESQPLLQVAVSCEARSVSAQGMHGGQEVASKRPFSDRKRSEPNGLRAWFCLTLSIAAFKNASINSVIFFKKIKHFHGPKMIPLYFYLFIFCSKVVCNRFPLLGHHLCIFYVNTAYGSV